MSRSQKRPAGAAGSGAAHKAASHKRAERERRLQTRKRKLYLRLSLIAVCILGAVLGVVGVYRSQVFEVRTIEVHGVERVPESRVLEIAAVPAGSTLLRVSIDDVGARLEADPWIREATITRDFPDALVLRIVERRPVALVDVGEPTFWLADIEGFMIAREAPDTTPTAGVVIRDVPDLQVSEGEKSDSEPLLNALRIWGGMSEEFRRTIRAISAETVDKTTLITHSDIEVLIGSAEDIAMKQSVASQILEEQAGNVVYINVRTVERPTWRGVDDE